MEEQPYLIEEEFIKHYKYNPKYGNERICVCGHPYYRHFDTYENMRNVGCKYCACPHFEEKIMKINGFKVGDIVKLKVDCLGNSAGTFGVVYENYNIYNHSGISVIFQNLNYDGFSIDEQERFLEYVGVCREMEGYTFENVMQLSKDFNEGGNYDWIMEKIQRNFKD